MPNPMPDIAILDDHAVVAQSIASALEQQAGIRTVGIAASLNELRRLLQASTPGVIVADMHLEGGSGIEVLELPEVRHGKVAVLFLSSYNRIGAMTASQRALTAGYLLKSTSLETLADAIRLVSTGSRVFDSKLRPSTSPSTPAPSDREVEILAALALGKTNVEVGHELSISSRTVESHLRRLFSRYGVSSRSQLLMLAIQQGWISAGWVDADQTE